MSSANGTKTAAPAVMSRREAIVGALALAAGTLLASRRDVALAANGEAMLQGRLMYDTAATQLTRYDPDILGGINDVSYCVLNQSWGDQHVGVYGSPTEQAGAASTGVYGLAVKAGHYGVQAEHSDTAGVALRATNPGGIGIVVEGKAKFSRSGIGTVSKGSSTKTVTVATGVGTSSRILVTLQGYGGSGVYLKYATRASATAFKVVLTKSATRSVKFAWMITD